MTKERHAILMCETKRRYTSKEKAIVARRELKINVDDYLPYACDRCNGWHLGYNIMSCRVAEKALE